MVCVCAYPCESVIVCVFVSVCETGCVFMRGLCACLCVYVCDSVHVCVCVCVSV